MKHTAFLLVLPLALSLGVSSCVGPGYGAGVGYNSGYGGGYNTYSTLPVNYNGGAYNHNGRYYTGGAYQTGSYSYQGRPYTSRYAHNGQYYYGGSHQHYTPQRGNGYNTNLHVNTPLVQQRSNLQVLPRYR